jgi:hypothetical protein
MLDEAMAIAGIVAGQMAFAVPTLELKTTFLRPCPAGPGPCPGRALPGAGRPPGCPPHPSRLCAIDCPQRIAKLEG